MNQSEQIDALAAALCEFQGAVTGAKKGGKNPHFRSNYTRLEDAWAAAREALGASGLSVTQWPEATDDDGVRVTTRVMHKSGQYLEGTLCMPMGKRDAQGMGSAITYGLRYAFLAALGLPPTDDDGNAAQGDREAPVQRQEATAPIAKPWDFEITFGKNAGTRLGELTDASLGWYATDCNNEECRRHAQAEQQARKSGTGPGKTGS